MANMDIEVATQHVDVSSRGSSIPKPVVAALVAALVVVGIVALSGSSASIGSSTSAPASSLYGSAGVGGACNGNGYDGSDFACSDGLVCVVKSDSNELLTSVEGTCQKSIPNEASAGSIDFKEGPMTITAQGGGSLCLKGTEVIVSESECDKGTEQWYFDEVGLLHSKGPGGSCIQVSAYGHSGDLRNSHLGDCIDAPAWSFPTSFNTWDSGNSNTFYYGVRSTANTNIRLVNIQGSTSKTYGPSWLVWLTTAGEGSPVDSSQTVYYQCPSCACGDRCINGNMWQVSGNSASSVQVRWQERVFPGMASQSFTYTQGVSSGTTKMSSETASKTLTKTISETESFSFFGSSSSVTRTLTKSETHSITNQVTHSLTNTESSAHTITCPRPAELENPDVKADALTAVYQFVVQTIEEDGSNGPSYNGEPRCQYSADANSIPPAPNCTSPEYCVFNCQCKEDGTTPVAWSPSN